MKLFHISYGTDEVEYLVQAKNRRQAADKWFANRAAVGCTDLQDVYLTVQEITFMSPNFDVAVLV